MKKFLRRLARFLIIIVVLGVIGGIAVTVIFRNQVGSRMVKAINEQISSELSFDAITVGFLSTFPIAEAELEGVLLKGLNGDSLAFAKSVTFDVQLMDLMRSKYIIEDILVQDGFVKLRTDGNGLSNFDIFKKNNASSSVEISKGNLENISLSYENVQNEYSMLLDAEKMFLEGGVYGKELNLSIVSKLISRYIKVKNTRFLQDQTISFEAPVEINPYDDLMEFKNSTVLIDGNQFRVNGDFQGWEKGNYMDIYIATQNSDLEGVLKLLPKSYLQKIGDIESDGSVNFNAYIKGLVGKTDAPEVKAEVRLKDNNLRFTKFNQSMDSVSMSVAFSNGELRSMESSSIEIKDFSGLVDKQKVDIQLNIRNFDNPNLDLELDGKIPFPVIYSFFKNTAFKPISGIVGFEQFKLKGRYENMIDPSLIALVESGGRINIQNVAVYNRLDSITIPRGRFDIENNRVDVRDLSINGFNSQMEIQATAFNSLPVLLADSRNSELAEMEFDMELKAPVLDVDQLLTTLELKAPAKPDSLPALSNNGNSKYSSRRKVMSSFLKGNIKAEVDSFSFGNINGKNFNGLIEFVNNEVRISGTSQALGGEVALKSSLKVEEQLQLEAQLNLQKMEMASFLKQTNELEQDYIGPKNVSGSFDSKVIIQAFWDRNGRLDKKRMRLKAELNFDQGEVRNFPMLNELGEFLRIENLEKVAFTEWKSYLEMRRGRFYVPVTFLRTPDYDIVASTENRKSGKFRYNVQVHAGANLASDIVRENPNLRPQLSQQDDYYNFYFSIFGQDTSKMEIRSTPRIVKAEFDRSMIRSREISRVLSQSFDNMVYSSYPDQWKDKPMIPEQVLIPTNTLPFQDSLSQRQDTTNSNAVNIPLNKADSTNRSRTDTTKTLNN